MDNRAIIEVIDSLDSTSGTNALSANQGRVLKEMIDTINAKDIITIKLEDSLHLNFLYKLINFLIVHQYH